VEIDYVRRRLTAHEPGSFAPTGAVVLSVDTKARIPLLDATLETRPGTSVPARLVVDLGSSALSLRLANSFVEKHRDAFAGLEGIVAPIGAGVGGRLMGEVVRLHALHLGNLSIAGPTAGLARERKGALEVGFFDGSIGTPVLAPWFAADYSGRRIFLSREAARDARYDASGLTLTSDGGAVLVDFVAARSPAAEAGLQPGDVIEKVDGREVAARDLHALRRALRDAETTRLLQVRRLGSVLIALRKLV
jgi:membrane-associated protease RseP (regulator of RpoE activity)